MSKFVYHGSNFPFLGVLLILLSQPPMSVRSLVAKGRRDLASIEEERSRASSPANVSHHGKSGFGTSSSKVEAGETLPLPNYTCNQF